MCFVRTEWLQDWEAQNSVNNAWGQKPGSCQPVRQRHQERCTEGRKVKNPEAKGRERETGLFMLKEIARNEPGLGWAFLTNYKSLCHDLLVSTHPIPSNLSLCPEFSCPSSLQGSDLMERLAQWTLFPCHSYSTCSLVSCSSTYAPSPWAPEAPLEWDIRKEKSLHCHSGVWPRPPLCRLPVVVCGTPFCSLVTVSLLWWVHI